MAINIKDPETDRLARQLAALTGEKMTGAIKTALMERLARERQKRECQAVEDRVNALIEDLNAGKVGETRDHTASLYDKKGLPA